jgi:hypothetical protein
MELLKELFGSKNLKSDTPDNTKLYKLLDAYQKANNESKYKSVLFELMNGNSFLLLPSEHDNQYSGGWETTDKDTTLKLKCIFVVDGLRVLGAFTDEDSLLAWSKEKTQYTVLQSKDIIKLCEREQIDRIVINSGLPTMFVLERSRENVTSIKIKEETTVKVGTPNRSLDSKIISKLIEQFKRIETIEEAYQYGQVNNGEFSIVLGFKLSNNSENSKTATINAVQNVLEKEEIDQLLDIFFIEDAGWYATISNIEGSCIYENN